MILFGNRVNVTKGYILLYMADSTAIIDGLAITFSQAGKGESVLLIHGWGDSRRTYKHLTESLANNYQVTALDLPGFGGSELPKTAWNLTDYAVFLEHFCNKLGIIPTAVVGHSNGGALAVHATSLGYLKPHKLVLLAPSGVRSTKRFKRAAIKTIAKLGKLTTIWLPLATRRRLQTILYGTVGSDMLVSPQMQETFKLTVRQDIQKDAKKLELPTLLIYGNKDSATSIKSVGKRLAACIKGSKLVIIPDAGHFVHHDASELVEQLTSEFLK